MSFPLSMTFQFRITVFNWIFVPLVSEPRRIKIKGGIFCLLRHVNTNQEPKRPWETFRYRSFHQFCHLLSSRADGFTHTSTLTHTLCPAEYMIKRAFWLPLCLCILHPRHYLAVQLSGKAAALSPQDKKKNKKNKKQLTWSSRVMLPWCLLIAGHPGVLHMESGSVP